MEEEEEGGDDGEEVGGSDDHKSEGYSDDDTTAYRNTQFEIESEDEGERGREDHGGSDHDRGRDREGDRGSGRSSVDGSHRRSSDKVRCVSSSYSTSSFFYSYFYFFLLQLYLFVVGFTIRHRVSKSTALHRSCLLSYLTPHFFFLTSPLSPLTSYFTSITFLSHFILLALYKSYSYFFCLLLTPYLSLHTPHSSLLLNILFNCPAQHMDPSRPSSSATTAASASAPGMPSNYSFFGFGTAQKENVDPGVRIK